MKNSLLTLCIALALPCICRAHQTDQYTIVYDDDELASNQRSGWDPNGSVPPQPEADYYLDLTQANNVYYRFEKVEGSDPVAYTTVLNVINGEFKIYSKYYWINKDSDNRSQYIYGSGDNSNDVNKDTEKTLSSPGGNLQLAGGTQYGVEFTFYPNGTSSTDTTPKLLASGGRTSPFIAISATATPTQYTKGRIDFTISTGGVLNSDQQKYTVTAESVDTQATVSQAVTVTGLRGSINLSDLASGATTNFNLTVEGKDLPVTNSPNLSQSGTEDLSSSTDVSITTYQEIYLVGAIAGVDDNPQYALDGFFAATAEPTIMWSPVQFNSDGSYQFRFVTNKVAYDDIESGLASGEVIYPADGNIECNNIWLNRTDNWYVPTEGKTSNYYWSPTTKESNQRYEVFYNLATNRISIGWSEMTQVADVVAAPGDEPVDVYSLQGIRLRCSVDSRTATDGLPHGLYIIGGRKVAVR